ncbi:MAG: hypothetical protein PUB21_08400 [Bacteroidales bacterium]|nr:hypothetical protein [Bacteroidales bacterium]
MYKAIFYKEWIKTKYYFILSTLLSWCFVGYSLLRINRVVEIKGAGHLWQVMLERNVIFIDFLTYLPLIIGMLFALVQFIPEMQQKRLKLTLHLPFPQFRIISVMLLFGLTSLFIIFSTNLIILSCFLGNLLAKELLFHVLLSAMPWYLAGITVYILAAWICLEPTWKRRILNALVAAGIIRIFFLSPTPEAYNRILPVFIVYTVLILLFPMLSVYRFKTGEQD